MYTLKRNLSCIRVNLCLRIQGLPPRLLTASFPLSCSISHSTDHLPTHKVISMLSLYSWWPMWITVWFHAYFIFKKCFILFYICGEGWRGRVAGGFFFSWPQSLACRDLSSLFSSVQSLSRVRLFATPWITARQASLSITNSQNSPKPMAIELVMPSNHLILCRPLFLPSIFSSSGSFPVSQFFTLGGQNIGVSASASVSPMNIQDWFPSGWTGCISLQSKGLSRVFSSTTVEQHQFFGAQLSL